jgi:ABC-type multidrug transport system ATPase subunit
VIQLNEVRKRFGARGVEALRGLTLRVAAGECVAFIGPNGAGKSTLLSLVLGFLHPSRGLVRIDGLDPRTYVRRRGAGWMPERFTLPDAWKVRASIEHFARLDGSGGAAARAAGRAALEHFGLEAHAERRASDLSHGLGRRLALAIATVTPRPLVVLDEPTDGLDAAGRVRFRERCAWLRDSGCTLLLASQDLAEIGQVADRAVVLEDGVVCDVLPLRAGSVPPAVPVESARNGDPVTPGEP